jgi:hypothetical protein
MTDTPIDDYNGATRVECVRSSADANSSQTSKATSPNSPSNPPPAPTWRHHRCRMDLQLRRRPPLPQRHHQRTRQRHHPHHRLLGRTR